VGLPGVLLSVLFAATVREPPRLGAAPMPVDAMASTRLSGTRELTRYLSGNWKFYLPFFTAVGLILMFVFGLATWMPTTTTSIHPPQVTC